MEYSYTENNNIWNSGDNNIFDSENYTIISGTNTFTPSAISYKCNYIQEHAQEQAQGQQYIQDDFWKKYFNGYWEVSEDDRLIKILKIVLEEFKMSIRGTSTISIEEKINLMKEALNLAKNRTEFYSFEPIKKNEEKPSYLDDDLFEI